MRNSDEQAIAAAASESEAVLLNPKAMLGTKTIRDILFQAGIHQFERTSYDETGSQYYRGIIGYRKGQLHADDSSLVSLSDTLAEFVKVNNKTTIDYILHDAVRSHFTRIQVVITPSSPAGEKPSVVINHIDTLATSEANNLTTQFGAIQKIVKTALNLDETPQVTHHVTNNTQTKNTCGDRCILSLLSMYTNTLKKQYNQHYRTHLSKEEVRDALVANEKKMREFIAFLDEQAQQQARKQAEKHTEFSSSFTASGVDDGFFRMADKKQNEAITNTPIFLNKLQLWKDDTSHPTTFTLTEKKINVDKNEAEFIFSAKRNGTELGSITLTRKDNEADNVDQKTTTWTCTTTHSDITEEQRFQLIAAESLALRLSSMDEREARKIGIVELNESERGERKAIHPQSKFPFTINSRPSSGSAPIALSQKEINLIKAHFDAGYKEVYYGGLKLTGKKTQITYHNIGAGTPAFKDATENPYATRLTEIYRQMISADSNEQGEQAKIDTYTNLNELVENIGKSYEIKFNAEELREKLISIINMTIKTLTSSEHEQLKLIINRILNGDDKNWDSVLDKFESEKQANITGAVVASAEIFVPELLKSPPPL